MRELQKLRAGSGRLSQARTWFCSGPAAFHSCQVGVGVLSIWNVTQKLGPYIGDANQKLAPKMYPTTMKLIRIHFFETWWSSTAVNTLVSCRSCTPSGPVIVCLLLYYFTFLWSFVIVRIVFAVFLPIFGEPFPVVLLPMVLYPGKKCRFSVQFNFFCRTDL